MRILIGLPFVAWAALAASAATQAGECPLSKAAHAASATTIPTTPVTHHEEGKALDIVDTAVGAKSFKTLVAAVKAAGLVETLKGKGPFTVFAPTDEAFEKLPKGTVENLLKPENKKQLVGILTYHVVPGKLMASRVTELAAAETVQGGRLPFEARDGKVKVGDANVVKTDINASNGVIHVIDSVLMPHEKDANNSDMPAAQETGDIVAVAMKAGSFKTLVAAVKAAGLVETLQGKGPYTVFAPTDEAFEKLPEGTVEMLLKPENKEQLVKILTYHVVPGKVMAADVVKLEEAKTAEGSAVSISTKDGAVMVDKAKVLKTDIGASNGVIHVIDSVIMP